MIDKKGKAWIWVLVILILAVVIYSFNNERPYDYPGEDNPLDEDTNNESVIVKSSAQNEGEFTVDLIRVIKQSFG